jgi:hypothetical protein
VGRARDDVGARLGGVPRGGGDDGHAARIFMRDGACADEIRLMGVIRAVWVAVRGMVGCAWGSVERNESRAEDPRWMDRM